MTRHRRSNRRTTDANHKKGKEGYIDDDGGGTREVASHAEAEIIPPEPAPGIPTFREKMMEAIGADRSGIVNARPTSLGSRVDMMIADKWRNDLGLSEATIIEVIRETVARKRDGPPSTFKYFTNAMQREAARQSEAPLQPANLNEARYDPTTAHDRREAAKADRLGRIVDAAVRNRAPSRSDFGFGGDGA